MSFSVAVDSVKIIGLPYHRYWKATSYSAWFSITTVEVCVRGHSVYGGGLPFIGYVHPAFNSWINNYDSVAGGRQCILYRYSDFFSSDIGWLSLDDWKYFYAGCEPELYHQANAFPGLPDFKFNSQLYTEQQWSVSLGVSVGIKGTTGERADFLEVGVGDIAYTVTVDADNFIVDNQYKVPIAVTLKPVEEEEEEEEPESESDEFPITSDTEHRCHIFYGTLSTTPSIELGAAENGRIYILGVDLFNSIVLTVYWIYTTKTTYACHFGFCNTKPVKLDTIIPGSFVGVKILGIDNGNYIVITYWYLNNILYQYTTVINLTAVVSNTETRQIILGGTLAVSGTNFIESDGSFIGLVLRTGKYYFVRYDNTTGLTTYYSVGSDESILTDTGVKLSVRQPMMIKSLPYKSFSSK